MFQMDEVKQKGSSKKMSWSGNIGVFLSIAFNLVKSSKVGLGIRRNKTLNREQYIQTNYSLGIQVVCISRVFLLQNAVVWVEEKIYNCRWKIHLYI